MNDPLKVIFKTKNNTGNYQYHMYVYIGNIPASLMKILEKFKDLRFYETLINLSKNDINDLEQFYGENWYTHFFNKHHLELSCKNILNNKQMLAELKKKFGEVWIENNVSVSTKIGQQAYTYGMLIKRNLIHHELRIKKKFEYAPMEHTSDDYMITDIRKRHAEASFSSIPIGKKENESGENESGENADENQVGGDDENPENVSDEEIDSEETFSEYESTSEEDEVANTEDIEKMYEETVDLDKKDLLQTNSMLKKALNDENILKNIEKNMVKFDTSKDSNIYKENVADVFEKQYITEQYLFRDDTIRMIKNKICCSIKNHPKFGDKCYIIPSRQYIWGEYPYNNGFDKIMIGMKWTQKSELLRVDIEPYENIKVYEELRDTIKNLRNDMKRFNSKIKIDDDNNNILYDYEGFYDNNEIYLIDIYNELGKNYSPTPVALTNLLDTYIKIYFPKISQVDLRNVVDYLHSEENVESTKGNYEREKIMTTYDITSTDLLLENEIIEQVEKVKIKYGKKYGHIMKENFVTQSMIHLLLHSDDTDSFKRMDLFKIFDDIIPSQKYPFIQYMTPDGNMTYKFNEVEIGQFLVDKNMTNLIVSWSQNVSFGLSFKIRVDDMKKNSEPRFITVNLSDLGKIDYKIQWKEDDTKTIDDIPKTYQTIKDLITEINTTSIKKKFEIPKDSEFKTAFITTIQRFTLDENYSINHNDLSKFARFFFPYFALVIEPRKRVSKIHESDDKSKFGTYLRFKRISKYENSAKIEQRIYYFIRNYEYTDQLIINEISKQFNITLEKAEEHLKRTLKKYTHIKKARKELKKFDILPKYKSPGIDIAIQGKTKDRYKIRISGARDKQQMNRILTALNILLFMYQEVYLIKRAEWQFLKEKLKKLNNIAERRHIVNDFVRYSDEKTNIKTMANADKMRIGYKPEKGQSHWSRVCQNSGINQRRRPQQFLSENIDELLKKGYIFNKATGMYERKIVSKKNGKATSQVVRAVKLNDLNEATGQTTGNEIYYTCDPEQNGIHMYVGFLTRSKNPNGEYMPCCFKKDQYLSKNPEKKNFFLQCIGKGSSDVGEKTITGFSDQLYILQDTNKIHAGRFGFLPKILDLYLNNLLELKRTIVQHYLISAPNGYFFKYGIDHGENSFLSAIAQVLDISVSEIIKKLTNRLKEDKSDILFTSLNNGDLKTIFSTKDRYLEYLENVPNIDFEQISHLLTIPSVISQLGLNIIIFAKDTFDREIQHEDEIKLKENCYMVCHNSEEVDNITSKERETIILFMENNKYYPIYNIMKESNNSKDIQIIKTFGYENNPKNIIEHIKDFYYKNCSEKTIKSIINKKTYTTAKAFYKELITKNVTDYLPKYQYIDVKNKCRYLITNNHTLIPVAPSGAIYNLRIIKNLDTFYDTYKNTLEKMNKLYQLFGGKLQIKPVAVNGTISGKEVEVRTIILQNNEVVPLNMDANEKVNLTEIKKSGLEVDTYPSFEKIDSVIENPEKNKKFDDRVVSVNQYKFHHESYELFRYTFSEYVNDKENVRFKDKITKIINANNDYKEKLIRLKLIIYRLVDPDLAKVFQNLVKIKDDVEKDEVENNEVENILSGGKITKFVQIVDKLPNLDSYKVKNIREKCELHDKNKCSSKEHCKWTHSGCVMILTKLMVVEFINKISIELYENNMRAKELLQLDGYYVNDIVNKNYYTERHNQKVIKSNNENSKKIIKLIFGMDTGEMLTKKKTGKNKDEINEEQLNKDNPLKDFGNKYIQEIIVNNNSVLRSYANCFNWLGNQFQDKHIRNLGYYGQKQTDIMIYLKSLIIDWLLDKQNSNTGKYLLETYNEHEDINPYTIKLASETSANTDGNVELMILNKLQNTPIVVYENDEIQKVFDIEKSKNIIATNLEKYKNNKNYINLQYNYVDDKNVHDINTVPSSVDVIYFK